MNNGHLAGRVRCPSLVKVGVKRKPIWLIRAHNKQTTKRDVCSFIGEKRKMIYVAFKN